MRSALKFKTTNKINVENVLFTSKNREVAIYHMRQIAQMGTKAGWINIGPALSDVQVNVLPQPTLLGRWISGRGPLIPMATWAPPSIDTRHINTSKNAQNHKYKNHKHQNKINNTNNELKADSGLTRKADSGLVGIEHGTGPKALERLSEKGLTLPHGWIKVQDHAKNGIVIKSLAGSDYESVMNWLINACQLLCPISLDDHWIAEVHYTKYSTSSPS